MWAHHHLGKADLVQPSSNTTKGSSKHPPNPWGDLGVDVAIESTGVFTKASSDRGGYLDHIEAGAKKVFRPGQHRAGCFWVSV